MKSLLPLLAALPLLACAAEVEPTGDPDTARSARQQADAEDDDQPADEAAAPAVTYGECTVGGDGRQYATCSTGGVAQCDDDGAPLECLDVDWCSPFDDGQHCTVAEVKGRVAYCNQESDGHWSEGDTCNTPLVLAFHQEAVSFTHPGGSFDVVGAGASFDTDWVAAATPWLALDLDGNGRIDDGAELFGSMTKLPDGTRAANGFEALAALDDDHDGAITARDAIFAKLVVWSDANQDRASQASELTTAAARGLVSIHLGYQSDRRCTGTACEVERATFEWRGGTGAVVDVHFAAR